MEENRADLGIRLRRRKRSVGENEVGRSPLDMLETVAARDAVSVADSAFGCLAIGVALAFLQGADDGGFKSDEADRHVIISATSS